MPRTLKSKLAEQALVNPAEKVMEDKAQEFFTAYKALCAQYGFELSVVSSFRITDFIPKKDLAKDSAN